jgi:ribosomal protein S18 acetylase RimI-like enzyme
VKFAIRPYHPSDLTALYRICLYTGDYGADASALYHDPDLMGHYYAAPYAVFEPDLGFVLTHGGAPCGYILGARDTMAFHARCERDWFPLLRLRYPLPDPDDSSLDAKMIRLIHEGYEVNEALIDYPAHLHLDMLPVAQGQGWGRRLVDTFLARLRALGVPGVHFEVAKKNPKAVGFYEHVGFRRVEEYPGAVAFGLWL